jgi:hypothetical protein
LERVFQHWDDPATDRAELAAVIVCANVADYPQRSTMSHRT